MDYKFCFFAVIISMCASHAKVFHLRLRSEVTSACDLGQWTKVVDFRFWALKCRSRRQLTEKEEKILSDIASRERGPKRDPETYDPTYGFEPYWEFGDWVFDKIRVPKKETKLCGHRCPKMYIAYGVVCGIDHKLKHRTFANICFLRSRDCKDLYSWRVAYRGFCLGDFPTQQTKNNVHSRADWYITDFYKRTNTTTKATTTKAKKKG